MDCIGTPIRLHLRETTGEEDVGELGNRVLREPGQTSGAAADAIEVDPLCPAVRLTGDHHDPAARTKCASQVVRQHEVPEVVDAEMDFKSIRSDTPSTTDACIVDQHIEMAVGRFESRRCLPS